MYPDGRGTSVFLTYMGNFLLFDHHIQLYSSHPSHVNVRRVPPVLVTTVVSRFPTDAVQTPGVTSMADYFGNVRCDPDLRSCGCRTPTRVRPVLISPTKFTSPQDNRCNKNFGSYPGQNKMSLSFRDPECLTTTKGGSGKTGVDSCHTTSHYQ